MNRAELLQRACHYRALAARVTDGQTREGLFDLAARYEALAKELEEGGAGDHPDETDD